MMHEAQEACANSEYCKGYSEDVDLIREREYPLLKGAQESMVDEILGHGKSASFNGLSC